MILMSTSGNERVETGDRRKEEGGRMNSASGRLKRGFPLGPYNPAYFPAFRYPTPRTLEKGWLQGFHTFLP